MFPTSINSTAHRTCSGNHNHTGLSVSSAVEGYISIADDFNIADTKVAQRFANARAQRFAASARQTNLGGQNVFTMDLGGIAGSICSFPHGYRGSGNADA